MNRGLLVFFVLSLTLVLAIVAACYILTYEPSAIGNHFGGIRTGYPISNAVDESIKPYINVTITGAGGYSGNGSDRMFLNGTVSWISSSQDAVKSLNNVYLVMYTSVDDREFNSTGSLISQQIGSHLEAFPNEPTLPNATIDHVEVVIPTLGLETPQYQFNLNCSTYIA